MRAQFVHDVDCTTPAAFEAIVKVDYAAMVIDVNYQFDHDDQVGLSMDPSANGENFTTVEGFRKTLQMFRQTQLISKINDYTVIVFCGFLQVEPFFKVMKEEFSHGRVFRYFWRKTPAFGAKNINPERPTNVIETILVGLSFKVGKKEAEPWQANYGPEAEDRTNVLEVPSVVKKLKDPQSNTNLMGDWQKPRKFAYLLSATLCIPVVGFLSPCAVQARPPWWL